MKKQFKGTACLLAGSLLAMNCILSASASALSRAELYEKYQPAFDAAAETGAMYDASIDVVYLDAAGNVCAGAYAEKELYVYGDTCTLDIRAEGYAYSYSGTLSQHYYYVVKPDGTACVTGSDYPFFAEGNTRKLRIPDEIDGYTVTEIGAAAFSHIKWNIPTLEEIVVPETVETIQAYAFEAAFLDPVTVKYAEGCKINIPSEVQYLGHGCYGSLNDALGSDAIVLPETLEYIDYWAFGRQTYLSELVLPKSPVVCLMGVVEYQTSPMQEATGSHSVAYPENGLSCLDYNEDGSLTVWPSEAATVPGDLNIDGIVDITDSVLFARYLSGDADVRISTAGLLNADVDRSGMPDASDLTKILNYIAHVITEL